MSKRLISILFVLVVLAWVPAAAATEPPPRTAVVGLESEPACLNVLLNPCNALSAATAVAPALAGAFRVRPDFVFEPMLAERVDVQAQPFALTYHIRPEAVWSDGVPVSADDFLFTLETIRDPANTTLRDGYEHVTEAVKLDAKTVTVRFSAPNPNWRNLFRYVLPRHVLVGHDFDGVWRDEIADPLTHVPIASGPFFVARWAPGEAITLTRNPRWWGSPAALDTIELAIVPSPTTQFDRIRNGTLDLIFPQPQFGVADLRSVPGVVVQSAPGTSMEHLDFNLTSSSMPLLRERWFRQAVAHALDREAIATLSQSPIVPSHPALNNLTLTNAEPAYEPVFSRYMGDRAAVAALMLDHGCVLGGDGIWVCGGIRASVKLATTTGNAIRELVQQEMIRQARGAGIELVADNSPATVLLGPRLGARDYESIMYAWVRGAGLPLLHDLYGCAGQRNFMGYCSPAVDALALAAQTEVDLAERVRLSNDANRMLAEDVPSLPLFMRIALLVRRDVLRGPQLNPGGFGTWNTEAWRIAGSDSTPPTVTCSATPSRIWLYNGKLVPIEIDVTVTDEGSGAGGFVLKSFTSDEPGEGDVQDFAVGTADTAGRVRAERDPEGDGRTYTFVYEGSDLEGNTATCEATVEIVRRKRGG